MEQSGKHYPDHMSYVPCYMVCNMIPSKIVQSLLFKTTEKALNYVKKETFGIENGDPIMREGHPVL